MASAPVQKGDKLRMSSVSISVEAMLFFFFFSGVAWIAHKHVQRALRIQESTLFVEALKTAVSAATMGVSFVFGDEFLKEIKRNTPTHSTANQRGNASTTPISLANIPSATPMSLAASLFPAATTTSHSS